MLNIFVVDLGKTFFHNLCVVNLKGVNRSVVVDKSLPEPLTESLRSLMTPLGDS